MKKTPSLPQGKKVNVCFVWEEGIRKSFPRCQDWKTAFWLSSNLYVLFPKQSVRLTTQPLRIKHSNKLRISKQNISKWGLFIQDPQNLSTYIPSTSYLPPSSRESANTVTELTKKPTLHETMSISKSRWRYHLVGRGLAFNAWGTRFKPQHCNK